MDPPPCNSGIVGIEEEDPNIVTIVSYSHPKRGDRPKLLVTCAQGGLEILINF